MLTTITQHTEDRNWWNCGNGENISNESLTVIRSMSNSSLWSLVAKALQFTTRPACHPINGVKTQKETQSTNTTSDHKMQSLLYISLYASCCDESTVRLAELILYTVMQSIQWISPLLLAFRSQYQITHPITSNAKHETVNYSKQHTHTHTHTHCGHNSKVNTCGTRLDQWDSAKSRVDGTHRQTDWSWWPSCLQCTMKWLFQDGKIMLSSTSYTRKGS